VHGARQVQRGVTGNMPRRIASVKAVLAQKPELQTAQQSWASEPDN